MLSLRVEIMRSAALSALVLFALLPSKALASASPHVDSNIVPRGFDISQLTLNVIYAHGALACIAWVILIPIGSILLKMVPSRYSFWVHTCCQGLGLLMYWVAVGMGIYMGIKLQKIDSNHAIIGFVIFGVSFIQPILGVVHHRSFARQGRRQSEPLEQAPDKPLVPTSSSSSSTSSPTVVAEQQMQPSTSRSTTTLSKVTRITTGHGVVHRWIGRALVMLAMVNGGLGILLQDRATQAERYVYAVVTAVMAGVYWGVVLGFDVMRRKSKDEETTMENVEREKQSA